MFWLFAIRIWLFVFSCSLFAFGYSPRVKTSSWLLAVRFSQTAKSKQQTANREKQTANRKTTKQ